MTESATRAILCWWTGLRSGAVGGAAESHRRGRCLEVIGATQPERDQHAPGPGTVPECVDSDRGSGVQIREQPDDDHQKEADAVDAAPDPSAGSPGSPWRRGRTRFAAAERLPFASTTATLSSTDYSVPAGPAAMNCASRLNVICESGQ